MDYVPYFRSEARAFEVAVRRAAEEDGAPLVPSCPDWTVTDLLAHLSGVHRTVIHIVRERLSRPPDATAPELLADLPPERTEWPASLEDAPHFGPVPVSLIDWFAGGAAVLESLFTTRDLSEEVWTYGRDRSIGFWLLTQTIETAVHRWDAEGAIGTPQPMPTGLATAAVGHTFEVMAPARRQWLGAPAGAGERFGFRQSDGPGRWTVCFEGDEIRLAGGPHGLGDTPDTPDAADAHDTCDVELTGTASDLMLFLWRRVPAERLDAVAGDRAVLDRYFTLVPPR
ncbi:maleylpyruvate isomerase family mycothiol-dependent enzyme [Streptomyces sp. SAJ15]|uniref:maleylpyruvate isomerase family mycothiol-dependent enzyme n=1 Tax=Streptomyces sp. SAJ15 TaxID=2011095 RepID=UPI0011852BC0|nr:maleylpyruvate isomerase family mycothiol-dependent enzyme [Streptomyces sp. SAJ15]TVL90545.1 hypothetical protein CD790_21495 [Streptomyces sp. SAJ15]